MSRNFNSLPIFSNQKAGSRGWCAQPFSELQRCATKCVCPISTEEAIRLDAQHAFACPDALTPQQLQQLDPNNASGEKPWYLQVLYGNGSGSSAGAPIDLDTLFSKSFDHTATGASATGELTSSGRLSMQMLAQYLAQIQLYLSSSPTDAQASQALTLLRNISLSPSNELTSQTKLVDLFAVGYVQQEGPYSGCLTMTPPPTVGSTVGAVELTELYSMEMLRNVPFVDWDRADSVSDLTLPNFPSGPPQPSILPAGGVPANPGVTFALQVFSDTVTFFNNNLDGYQDALDPVNGDLVTPAVLFRSMGVGVLAGPYVSQLLMKPFVIGAQTNPNTYQLLPNALGTGGNFYLDYSYLKSTLLQLQNGVLPSPNTLNSPATRFVATLRDLTTLVHTDALYQWWYCSAVLLFNSWHVPLNPGWTGMSSPDNSVPFFSGDALPDCLGLIGKATIAACQVVFRFKWQHYAKLRPEEFSLLVQNVLDGTQPGNPHGVSPLLLDGVANPVVVTDAAEYHALAYGVTGSWTLDQTYIEGCPIHPSYPCAHCVIGGAASVVLKAFLDTTVSLNSLSVVPVVANPANPTHTIPFSDPSLPFPGTTADIANMTVQGEINKLVDNIGKGRMAAGIHYLSDHLMGIQLGEQVAIALLQSELAGYPSRAQIALPVTLFDDTQVLIQYK
jgi:hypothetical protein